MKNKALVKLIQKHGGKVLPFRKLPSTAKYAIAYYMSIDGEAWEVSPSIENAYQDRLPPKHDPSIAVVRSIGWYTKNYGNEKLGFVKIPTDELLAMFLEKYRGLYKNRELYEKRSAIWPVILDFSPIDEDNVGPIQDGWHRFSDYVTMGLKEIPCIYYP